MPILPVTIFLAAIFYIIISAYNRKLGLWLMLLLLPTYVLRFKVGPIFGVGALPSTWLEIMILISSAFVILDFCLPKLAGVGLNTPINFALLKNFFTRPTRANALPYITIFGFILLVGATLGVIHSVDLRSALGLWRAFYIEPVLMFFVFFLRFREKRDWEIALKFLALAVIGTSAVAIYQYFTGWMIFNPYWAAEATRRSTSIFGFPNGIGLFASPLVPMFITMLIYTRNLAKIDRVIYVLAIILGVVAVVVAHSTGAVVAITGAIFLIMLTHKKTKVVTIVLAVVGVALLMFPQFPSRDELMLKDFSGQIRMQMWGETIEFLRAHSFWGAGLASYQKLIAPYHVMHVEIYHHPHNIFLNFWIEAGAVGLVGILGLLLAFYNIIILTLRRAELKNAPLAWAAAFGIAGFLIHGLVDTPYIKNDLSVMFWFIAALACYAYSILYFAPSAGGATLDKSKK